MKHLLYTLFLLGGIAFAQNNASLTTSEPVDTKVIEVKDCDTTSAITFENAQGDDIGSVTMNVSEPIDSAALTYSIIEQGLTLLSFDGDFCTYLAKSDIDCPLSKGTYKVDFSSDSDVVSSSPSNYTVNIDVHNGDTKLGCADVRFRVPESPETTINISD